VETDRLIMLRRAEAQQKFGDPERWRDLTASMPFGRAATPREIGQAVAFLASPVSGYTTGTVLTIDGGG
jgi:NAD(P)-dependent dehydrogenase (short-subunit alcohol dehydrogenase family)